ncbi:ABC transporter substrate-binding protein [Nocardia bovistercoris]|uniref:ABC transporter substrate-binding protein n=1 Tax=Nocardia bovistercoris TaxID=2785916 RepID=A0A931N5B8_9NOCA|nr:ABC transporter substrate-binding protein [Nocardia bovistercoris]MBH0779226.1 ABC transporter substrate-binding protein [Nocardia bovistercoris]
MSLLTTKRWLALPCIALAATLFASGCSSDDKDSSAPVDKSVLGPENKATGAPVKIGFITTGPKAPVYTEETEVANATVAYINNHLGGINGRPIELIACEDEIQVSLSRNCANKFVQSDAVAVVSGEANNADTVAAITSPSSMAYLTAAGGQQSMMLPNTFVLVNALNSLAGVPAAYAKQNGYKKVAIMTVDSPTAVDPLKQLGPFAFGNAGAQVDVVPVPLGTADMTPQVQAALEKKPEMFHLLGDVSFCTAALKAMKTLNTSQPVMSVTQCVGSADAAAQIPGGYEGVKVVANAVFDTSTEDGKLFAAVVDGSGAKDPQRAASIYRTILSLQSALNGAPGEITRESTLARLSAMPEPKPLPLSGGGTFQCGSKPIPVVPNICSDGALLGTAKEDGTLVDIKPIDTKGIFSLPGTAR